MTSFFETLPALTPMAFFALTADAKYTKAVPTLKQLQRSFALPDTSAWLAEESFVKASIAWNEEGLFLGFQIDKPFETCAYPLFSEADAIEVFIDTRDLKTAGFATKFCHQFVFLPQEVQGISALEITRFRTEDTHPICDPAELKTETFLEKDSYSMWIHIPAQALHGYDPIQCDRIGFNYRVHRYRAPPQHFSVSSAEYSIEQLPRLWGTLKLVNSR